MKVGSLFTGIGGFDLGFERAGFEIEWQCEIDAHARAVLEQHWPTVLRMEDVRWVNGKQIEPVDVLVGGFPCQDVSVAGRRAGLAGERSGLWFEFHRILGELRPPLVLIENVPGLLSSNRGADFAVILQGLVELGYRVCWRILDAQFFGVAQRRRRVFIIGSLGDGRSATVLLEPESLSGNPSPSIKTPTKVTSSSPDYSTKVIGALDTECGGTRLTGQSIANGHIILGTMTARMNVALGARDVEEGAVQVVEGKPRRLTPVECERLQGFPDDWTAISADVHRYKQLGNAIAVPVAEWIARRIQDTQKPGDQTRLCAPLGIGDHAQSYHWSHSIHRHPRR